MRLGILGGTFDPPHLGHYLTAIDALEALELDRVLFVPNAVQPLKGSGEATARERFGMLQLMLEGDARFGVETLEIERDGLSFTVDTLEALATRHPGAKLYFLGGEDILESFSHWRSTDRILQLCTLAILARSQGSAPEPPQRTGGERPKAPEGSVYVPTRTIEISSTEIRERCRAGASIRGFVAPAVEAFIESRSLYRKER